MKTKQQIKEYFSMVPPYRTAAEKFISSKSTNDFYEIARENWILKTTKNNEKNKKFKNLQ